MNVAHWTLDAKRARQAGPGAAVDWLKLSFVSSTFRKKKKQKKKLHPITQPIANRRRCVIDPQQQLLQLIKWVVS